MNKYASLILISALSGTLIGCGDAHDALKKKWSDSVAAPAAFEFWQGSGQTVRLPSPRDQFLSAVSSLGGEYYMKGDGTEFRTAPQPWPRSPCKGTNRVIVVAFPFDSGVGPFYAAYLNEADMVECVEKQFAYAAP